MPEVKDPRLLARLNGGVQTRPADPRLPFQVTKDRNEAAASQFAPGKAQADTTIAQAEAANATAIAAAERDKAIADAKKAEVELEKLRMEQSKVDPKSGAYKALQDQIDRVTELYRLNLQGGAPNVINNLIPDFLQGGMGQFDAAAQGLANPFMSAFRVPGVGSQSDTELRQFLESNVPQQGDSDQKIEEKLRNIQTRLNAEVPQQTDKSAPLVGGEQPGQVAFSQTTRDQVDPFLRGVGGKVGQMLAQGAPDLKIIAFLRENGVDPANTNINDALKWRKGDKFKAWQRANPGKAWPIGPEFYTKQVPLSGAQKIGNAVGQSDLGAYAINAAQGLTGNRLDDIASALGGNGEAINTGIQLSRANSPTSSLVGDLSGQAMAQYLMGRLPGFRALPNSALGRVGEDAIYGAYAGQGEGDTLGGIAANVGGGLFGRGVGGAAKVAAKGINPSDSLKYLNDRGFDLTIGQIGRGSNSRLGHAIGGLEDRAAGAPGYDAIINDARLRGLTDFNQQAFKDLGVSSGATGAKGVAEGQNIVNNAYNFLDPLTLPVDAQFAGRNAMVRANLPSNLGSGVSDRLNDIDSSITGGNMMGRDWQSALRGVRIDRASIAGQPFADKAVGSLNEVENNLIDLAGRQGPPGTAANLANANAANAKFQTLAMALDNGPTQARDELFTPQRLDDAARAGARNFGGRVSSMKGNRPFYELTQAGMDVLPNRVPDSGTAGRVLMYAPLYGAGLGAVGTGLGALAAEDNTQGAIAGGAAGSGLGSVAIPLLLSGVYGKRGQRAIQNALLGPRPKVFENAIEGLEKNLVAKHLLSKRAAGMFGSAAARDLLLYPELDQGL